MALINQIRDAVASSELREIFTTEDISSWVNEKGIVKDDGELYAESSITSILSNSAIKNAHSSNQNKKVLGQRDNASGKAEYWFL